MKKVLSALMVSAILAATSANAFDNTRRGFMLDLGIGAGVTSFTQKIEGHSGTEGSRRAIGAVLTSVRIGAWINRVTQVYLMSSGSYFTSDTALGNSVTIVNSFGGVGLTRYARSLSPSPYIFGAIGSSGWSTVFEPDNNTWAGFGLAGGLGFKFSRHTSLEAVFTYSRPQMIRQEYLSGSELKATTNAIVFGVTLNYMAY